MNQPNNNPMDIVTRQQLNILIQLAEVDKHFAVAEREWIFKVARANDFPDEDVKDLIRNPEPISSLGALSPRQRFEYIYSCIQLVLADEKIFESELRFCREIAVKLGMKQTVVDFLVEQLPVQPKEVLSQQVSHYFA
jgi:uncharacterized tellurite resistance protein B-like protein